MVFLFLTAVPVRSSGSDFDFSSDKDQLEMLTLRGVQNEGIPAIIEPKFISSKEADKILKENDRVMGIKLGEIAKAYPIRILNWHQLVNDSFNGIPVVITYCPLCGLGTVFYSAVDNKPYTFGVTGHISNSDMLFFDHQTESLWSQIGMQALTGKMSGTKLNPLPVLHTTWAFWKKKHPHTLVLSFDTGHMRDYTRHPYGNYDQLDFIMFPLIERDDRYHLKEKIIGIMVKDIAKAYPFTELKKSAPVIEDKVGDKLIKVHFDKGSSTAFITDRESNKLPSTVCFWFVWYTFNSNTLVYTAN